MPHMSQSYRRLLVWTVIACLLLLGTLLAVKASDAPSEDRAPDAFVQAFGCTVSLLSFRLPQAEQACGRTIALMPDSPLGYKYRGYTYLLEHRFERAETDFRDAVKLAPRDADIQAGLGQSLSGQGHFDEAVQIFGAAMALAPDDVRYLAARCWALAGQGKNYKAALADCDRALTLQPKSAVAYDARGLAELKQGRNEEAVRDYSQSLSLDEGRPTALFGRGLSEWHLGQMTLAASDLKLARDGDSDIDDTYVLVGVVKGDCRTEGAFCSLPQALRPKAQHSAKPFLTVSYPKP